jgi:hypothetical protein
MKRFVFAAVLSAVAIGLGASISKADDAPSVKGNPPVKSQSAATYTLRSRRAAGALDRVEIVLEVGGNARTSDVHAAADKPRLEKISNVAKFAYDEKTLTLADKTALLRSIRHYDQASAVLKIGDSGMKPELRETRRLIGVAMGESTITVFSPQGALTEDEHELLDFQGNSLMVDRLLPEVPVAIGDRWKHSEHVIAALCGLDMVAQCDVESVLKDVVDGSARIEISGRVTGKNTGRSVTIDLKAKHRFDLKTGRSTWLGLLLNENSSTGPVKMGLDVSGKMQMRISPLEKSPALEVEAIKNLPLSPTPELEQVVFDAPEGGWEISHDRRWWVMHSTKKTRAELRLVDQGEPLADCSIIMQAKSDTAKDLTLEEFQDEVRQGLGKNFKQLVRASQQANAADYRVYCVAVHGVEAELPIRWFYYRVSDKLGHQAVIVFTLKEANEERFATSGEDLVAGFRFVDEKK